MLQTIIFFAQLAIVLPIVLIHEHNWLYIPVAISADFILNSIIAVWASFAAKRWNLLGALPYFYFLRWVEISIYIIAFVEIMILKRFQTEIKGWATEGRRYKLNETALLDVAQL